MTDKSIIWFCDHCDFQGTNLLINVHMFQDKTEITNIKCQGELIPHLSLTAIKSLLREEMGTWKTKDLDVIGGGAEMLAVEALQNLLTHLEEMEKS